MTDEPNTKNTQTPDQAGRKDGGGASSAGGQLNSPTAGSAGGDPRRLDYGDRSDDQSKRNNPTDRNDKQGSGGSDDQRRDDAGEGHKGPRAEMNTGNTSDRSQGDRSNAGQQGNDKSKSMQGDGKSGSHGSAPMKDSGGKSGSQSGGAGR